MMDLVYTKGVINVNMKRFMTGGEGKGEVWGITLIQFYDKLYMIFHQQKLHTFQSERQDSSKTKERHINLKEKEWKMLSDNHYFNNEIL